MSILKHFGFGLGTAEKNQREKAKFEAEINKLKAAIKGLYKDGINEKCQEMKDLEQLAEEMTARLKSQDGSDKDYHQNNADLARRNYPALEKKARAVLKQQKEFEKLQDQVRGRLTELKYILNTDDEKADLVVWEEELGAAKELGKKADYPGGLNALKELNRALERRDGLIPAKRKEYIKKLDKVQAAMKELKVLGFGEDSDEYKALDGMVKAAAAQAKDAHWEAALGELDGLTAIKDRPAVKKARKKAVDDLASGEFMKDADEDKWADAVIDLFDINPRLGKDDFYGKEIKIKIGPKDYKKYKALQTHIAGKVDAEVKRPTIDLTVQGKNPPKASFGIIGGTGPLSDAEMLEKTMEGLEHSGFDEENVHIRLMSAPTPRNAAFSKGPTYAKRMRRFAKEPHSKMALASNTAHLNLGKARKIRTVGGGGRKDAAGTGETHQVQDLAGGVVAKIMKDAPPPPKPVIMGTKMAYDGDLYGNKFQDEGIEAGNVDPKDSIKLQAWIDRAKGGEKPENGLADELKAFIKEEVAKQGDPTHLVLSCTELPLALGGPEKIKEFEDELNKERQKQGKTPVHFFDTEQFFADQYADMVKKNVEESPPPPEADDDEEIDEETLKSIKLGKKEFTASIAKALAVGDQPEIDDEDVEDGLVAAPTKEHTKVAKLLYGNITKGKPVLGEIAKASNLSEEVLREAKGVALDSWPMEEIAAD